MISPWTSATINYFNPRSREGSDFGQAFPFVPLVYFNPRSREGSDFSKSQPLTCNPYFNPRSREGSDNTRAKHTRKELISIHAPAKGATRMIMCVSIVVEFQSTLPRRERRGKFLSFDGCGYISIHAPAKGATTSMGQAASTSIFQSTLPRRERRWYLISRVLS